MTLWEQTLTWFAIPGAAPELVAVSVGLALAFGAVWLCAHWPWSREPRLIAAAIAAAFIAVFALNYIQVPLQERVNGLLMDNFDNQTLFDWLLLAGLPSLILSGLVQEGAKLVPIAFWWWRNGRYFTPAAGLAIGAVAGAAFGIFEAFWVFNRVFVSGWTTDFISALGFTGISPFWERFFAIGLHTSLSALAGWGLAKGKGWQVYLIVSGLHTLFNFPVLLFNKGYLDVVQVETVVAVLAVVISGVVLWIHWTRDNSGYQIDFLPEEDAAEEQAGEGSPEETDYEDRS